MRNLLLSPVILRPVVAAQVSGWTAAQHVGRRMFPHRRGMAADAGQGIPEWVFATGAAVLLGGAVLLKVFWPAITGAATGMAGNMSNTFSAVNTQAQGVN
ncbi:MAG: hypothetical protein ACYDAG_10920 [Chloroflexota bacterium]